MSAISPETAVTPRPFRDPVQFLAFGFGSGLSPWAPGTAGTLVAVPLYLLLAQLPPALYAAAVLLAIVAGIAICHRASEQLGVHDHPGIVWDEFAGYWVTMCLLPATWSWAMAGFVAFRVFDILKPWPIGWLDRRVHGGLGIMIDDIVAGIMACGVLHVGRWLLA